MDPATAQAYLQSARQAIHQALQSWDPTDLDRVGSATELLRAAVSDMRIFEAAVRDGQVPHSQELCTEILSAKTEVSQATRVVDACVAFHRGLAARMGQESSGYNSDGRLNGDGFELDPEVLA